MSKYEVVNNSDGTVTICENWFEELSNDSDFLNALRNCGVDNWDGYGYAQEEYASYLADEED